MRAPVQEPIATSGQSLAKSQFERLNWGVVENAYHDLGTDLILMHRDVERFDRGMLMGAQVKTSASTDSGTKYFSESVKDAAGEVEGWWFRESTREHFDYWLANDLAHLIVLVDLQEEKCYWAHISEAAVVWTPKGAKVFVPRRQTVDQSQRDALTLVAASSTRGPSWEGSAWTDPNSVPDQAKLRYALITPRLVAPHPNSRPDSVEPEQAVAALVQCRFHDLDERRKLAEAIPGSSPSPYPSVEDAKKSPDIIWQFYAALHIYISSGQLDAFPALVRRSSQPHIRAAIIAAYVSFLIENGRAAEGLACLDKLRRLRQKMSLVDNAWLDMQRARCLAELGQEDLARQISIALQALPTSARADPTARAIAASAAIQIFTTASWFSGEVSGAIKRTDTAASWWRSQVIAWGLGEMLDRSFIVWTAYDEPPLDVDRAVFLRLRTASLLSGFAGDHSGWRHSLGQLAKYGLQTTARNSDYKMIASFLSNLRQSGGDDDVWSATRRIVANGPVSAAEQASARVDLDASTATTSLADIRLAGDVLNEGRADAICKWALKTIRNPRPFVRRVRPSYSVEKYVLEMLAAVMPAGTKTVRRQVIQHILRLPAIADTALATYYSTVLRSINADDWTPKTLSGLALRKGDDRPLAAEIERVLGEHDLAARQRLINRASRGSTQALVSLGDVTKLPRRVVRPQIEAAGKKIRAEVVDARNNRWAEPGAHESLQAMAVLNIWHPKIADWDPIVEILSEPKAQPAHCQTAVSIIAGSAHRIDNEVKTKLLAALEVVRSRQAFPLWTQEHQALVQVATAAIDALSPGHVTQSELWRLMGGGSQERKALAKVVGRRSDPAQLELLAYLAHDRNPSVRCEAARWLCRWQLGPANEDQIRALIRQVIDDPGVSVPLVAAEELRESADSGGPKRELLQRLETHVSSAVRRRARGDQGEL